MRRATGAVIAFVVFAAVAVLIVASATDKRRAAFTLGVQPTGPAATVPPGAAACQLPIDVPEAFDRVAFELGELPGPGPRLEARVRSLTAGRRVLGIGVVAPGYETSSQSAAVGRIPEGARVEICIKNAGRVPVVLNGGNSQAARTSTAVVGGLNAHADLALVFLRSEPRSALSLVPEALEHATLFHPAWVGRGLLWVLLALVLAGVPLLLWRALAAAEQVPSGSYDSRP
jgi:hypothetical protein